MKAKFLAIAALAAVVGMTACSKEDGAGKEGNGDEKAVLVTVQGEGINTRAVDDKLASGAVAMTNGKIIFTNGSEIVTHVIDIVSGTGDYDKTAGTVGQGKLATGAAFTELNPTTQKVYLIGNYTGAIGAGDDLSTINLTQLSQSAVANVTIFGGTALSLVSGNNYSATFEAKPVIARIEIEKFTPGGNITSCKVTGVFVNRYHSQMGLYGEGKAANFVNNSYTEAFYAPDGGGSYTAANSGAIYDYAAAGLLQDAGSGKAYAYNCLAPVSGDQTMISIVIRLSDIMVNGAQFEGGGDRFLTIQNFYKDPNGAKTKITSLEQGNIYTIPNVAFTQNDLTTQPELKSINADVTATIMEWFAQVIGYDFD